MSIPIKQIGLLANPEKANCRALVRQAARLLADAGRSVVMDEPTRKLVGWEGGTYPDTPSLADHSDLILVFGGDGTMLRVAREVAGRATPILGINVGRLGFLTAVPSSEMPRALELVLKGECYVESRGLIEASTRVSGRIASQQAFNDFVASRGAASRIIELEVAVDGEVLTRYSCDGLVVSTPTGSTGYSLAAGGAIVSPSAEVFAVTPICPHTLSNRCVILSLHSTIEVKVLSERPETIFSADGQVQTELEPGEIVSIRRSPYEVGLLHPKGHSFFKTLCQKLHWSGSAE